MGEAIALLDGASTDSDCEEGIELESGSPMRSSTMRPTEESSNPARGMCSMSQESFSQALIAALYMIPSASNSKAAG